MLRKFSYVLHKIMVEAINVFSVLYIHYLFDLFFVKPSHQTHV